MLQTVITASKDLVDQFLETSQNTYGIDRGDNNFWTWCRDDKLYDLITEAASMYIRVGICSLAYD